MAAMFHRAGISESTFFTTMVLLILARNDRTADQLRWTEGINESRTPRLLLIKAGVAEQNGIVAGTIYPRTSFPENHPGKGKERDVWK